MNVRESESVNSKMKFILVDVLKNYVLNIDEIKLNTMIFLLFHIVGYFTLELAYAYYVALKSELTFNTANSYSL